MCNPEDNGSKYDDEQEPSCGELYGPYPSAIPKPFLEVRNEGREGTIPSNEVLEKAKTQFDVPADVRDVNTPDAWVPRDGRLVRLTGKHPFNVEPPVSVLNEYRFITPSSLHYVRNHGACPKLSWNEHTLCVGGPGVRNPLELSMDELAAMPPRELPVTLVCAGNRRKEQNMIKQTIGFNWGPSGVGTNVYKGVMLRDLLLQAGVSERNMRDKHVEFLGVEDLPNKAGAGPFPEQQWGKLVKYGTSIPLARAMNPAYDVLIAYGANGEDLQPDHGFPVRLIIPGYIGGRMIKWLKHINVIEHETYNHYHYHDNRILPPHITAEESMNGWWYKPEYIFNELNINSAMTQPDHNSTLSLSSNLDKNYEVAGYAYTGGGRMISRVEVSTDEGVHWNLARIDRKERPNDYGMYWCWIWWAFDLPVTQLIGCKEIWCRAWDESNNGQGNKPTWNLMGMGNNQCFRVKVHIDRTASGEPVVRFEHPTQPGQQKGGWMTRLADKPSSAGFGRLLDVGEVPAPAPKKEEEELTDANGNKLALHPKKEIPLKLQHKEVLSRDSFLIDFALPTPKHVLGLPTGMHIYLSAMIDGKKVMRAYTPISSNYDVGCVKFVIKAYPPCKQFPKGGKMSQYLDSLKVGDTMNFKGPVGEFDYHGKGDFTLEEEKHHGKYFNMIAGGTGITPCMQIAAEILRHDDDPTQVSLIFAARIEGDLLLRSTLDEWAEKYPKKFKVHYILSDSWAPDWKYSTGFVDKKLFEDHLYDAGEGVYNLMCGPPVMLKRGCFPNLEACGHAKDSMFQF